MNGVAIMKMINSTSTTSVNGVILISAINFGFLSLLFILFRPDQIDELGRTQLHVRDKMFNPFGEIIVGNHRWDGHKQSCRRADKCFSNPSDNNAHPAGPCCGDIMKRPDNPQNRSEEPNING